MSHFSSINPIFLNFTAFFNWRHFSLELSGKCWVLVWSLGTPRRGAAWWRAGWAAPLESVDSAMFPTVASRSYGVKHQTSETELSAHNISRVELHQVSDELLQWQSVCVTCDARPGPVILYAWLRQKQNLWSSDFNIIKVTHTIQVTTPVIRRNNQYTWSSFHVKTVGVVTLAFISCLSKSADVIFIPSALFDYVVTWRCY